MTGVLQEVCAQVWELCVKAELSIAERMLPDLESRTLSDIFYLFWQMQRILVVGVMFLPFFFFPQEKEMLALVCTQREQNKTEQRKRGEGVTDSGNGCLGSEGSVLTPAH